MTVPVPSPVPGELFWEVGESGRAVIMEFEAARRRMEDDTLRLDCMTMVGPEDVLKEAGGSQARNVERPLLPGEQPRAGKSLSFSLETIKAGRTDEPLANVGNDWVGVGMMMAD